MENANNQKYDIEEVISYLTGERNLRLKDLENKAETNRGFFNSWRKSTKPARRKELAAILVNGFPEHFPDGKMIKDAPQNDADIQTRYIAALEKHVASLEKEVAHLRDANETHLAEIREVLTRIEKGIS